MVNKLSKKYFEKLAQLKTKFIFPEWGFELGDRPDLQDEVHNVGIEVTIAQNTDDGIFSSEWNKYAGTGITSNDFITKLRKKCFQEQVIPNAEHMACIKVYNNINVLIEKIISAIKIKTDKFSDYKKFKKNGLFIFCPEPLWEEQFSTLKQLIYEENYPFDFFIISMINKMILIENNELKIYEINFDKIEQLQKESLDFSQNH